MSAAMFIGVGTGVGALAGAGAGFAFFKLKNKAPKSLKHKSDPAAAGGSSKKAELTAQKKGEPVSALKDKTSTSGATATNNTNNTITTAPLPPQQVVLFDATVTYLTKASELYTPLIRFENYLQAPQERKSFARAVEHIDNFLGMDALLHGREPISRGALPTIAQSARNKTLRLLDDIIAFSYEDRTSTTKKEAMQEIRNEIATVLDEMVTDMLKIVAATNI